VNHVITQVAWRYREASTMNHTPGPWSVDTSHGITVDADTRRICRVPVTGYLNVAWLREADANARLIAAAPELLRSLEALVVRCGVSQGEAVDDALAAIKKAKGAAE
jgi:hypothetical protein